MSKAMSCPANRTTNYESFTNITICHCCVWENWDWMWEIVVLDYFEVGDSTAGLFCCGRLWYWTILKWEILLLDFCEVGDSDAGLSS